MGKEQQVIAKRNTEMASDNDLIQTLERARLDLDDACVNMLEAIKTLPNDGAVDPDLYGFALELSAIRRRLDLHIKYYKRIAAEAVA